MRGYHTEPITDDLKERFLDLIASGYTRPEAASALDASARQLRALCNPNSTRYDEDFARRYNKLTERGGEQQTALLERLESAAVERGVRSSDRLLEKLLTIYHPDWEIHRPQALQSLNLNINIEKMFEELSTETLERMIAELEQKQQLKALPDIEAA